MSDRPEQTGNPPTDLDFQTTDLDFQKADHGQDDDTSLACASCGRSIDSHYYTAGGGVLCEGCKFEVEAALTAGSGTSRLLKASAFGLVAAAVSAAIWMAVTELTGYEIGLVAILVGFLVGQAVAIGSERRGGWLYQTMAVVLTYFAIVATYVPYVVEGLMTAVEEEAVATEDLDVDVDVDREAAAADEMLGATPETPLTDPTETTDPTEAATAEASIAEASVSEDGAEGLPPALGLVVFLAIVLSLAAAAPFLAGFENVIGILIIGIALWEAWRRNKRVDITIDGPFQVGRTTAS